MSRLNRNTNSSPYKAFRMYMEGQKKLPVHTTFFLLVLNCKATFMGAPRYTLLS